MQNDNLDRDIFDDLDPSSEAQVPTKRMLNWAKNSAIYRLERQMMSEHQLTQAISKKAKQKFPDISQAQITALAKHAVEFGYSVKALDDEAFAEVTTRSALRVGKSRQQIKQRLKTKGIEAEIIETMVADVSDFQSALIFAKKRRFGPFRRDEPDEKRKNKEMSAFARAGYSFEIARKIYFMSIGEAEDELNNEQNS